MNSTSELQVVVSAAEFPEFMLQSRSLLREHLQKRFERTSSIDVFAAGVFQSPSVIARSGLTAIPSKGRAQLALLFVVPEDNEPTLWERVTVPDITWAEYTALYTSMGSHEYGLETELVEVALDWTEPPPLPSVPDLWRYNPERLRKVMPYGEEISRIGLRHKGAPTVELQRATMECFAAHDAAMLKPFPFRRRSEKNRNEARALDYFAASLAAYATYSGNARQLFDIPESLCELFRHTDVDDIQWANVRFPYPCFYLHFGPQQDMDLGEGWLAEGVYLQEIEDNGKRYVNFCMVSAPPSMSAFMAVDVKCPPAFVTSLSAEQMGVPLAEALDLKLSERMARLKVEIEDEPLQRDLQETAREQGAPAGASLVSVQRIRAQEELALLRSRHDTFKALLRLVVNALCYLTAYPKDIKTVWPARTPTALLKELHKAGDNRNERKRVLTRLAAQGYSAVHVCGSNLVSELEKNGSTPSSDGGRVIATHWARGHWKRQPHGPQNSLRKLQWRMPAVRRSRLSTSDAAPEEPLGHIYLTT